MRIGHGYDAHRLEKGRALIIGGVCIPFELGLMGHSDADVLSHAVMDAMLGAAALGDIGKIFPDSDDRFKDADSLALMEAVNEMVSQTGYEVENLDCTIIAERPRLSPYIEEMREKISGALGISPDCTNVKATTEEGMGFTGSGHGIAAHAVVLLRKK